MGILFLYLLFLISSGYGFMYVKILTMYQEYNNYRLNVLVLFHKINDKFDLFDVDTIKSMDFDEMNIILDSIKLNQDSESDSDSELSEVEDIGYRC